MNVTIHGAIDAIPAAEWNALDLGGNPFLRHEFLAALEHHDAVGETYGWLPQHLAVHGAYGRLIGAAPLYLKTNSYGEFVFDWAWAEAYHRAGLDYYPKLVSAVPYTPATGHRLLVAADVDTEAVARALAEAALEHARNLGVSSLHWLFPDEADRRMTELGGTLMPRLGCQYHWYNHGYADFDAFLATMTSKKRKNIRQERRRVVDAGIELEVRHGDEMEPGHWALLHRYYTDTFDRKGGIATLSRGFFEELGRTLPRNIVTIFAREGDEYVAAALCVRGEDTLYGRHWGCDRELDALHFEACYYQGIDYCIREGLARFEPGAQGEHKVPRGFEPTATHSTHWVAEPVFARAVADFLARETPMVEQYMDDLRDHLPFRESS